VDYSSSSWRKRSGDCKFVKKSVKKPENPLGSEFSAGEGWSTVNYCDGLENVCVRGGGVRVHKKNGMRPFRRALVRGVVVRVLKKMA